MSTDVENIPAFDPDRPDFTPYGLTCSQWHPRPMRRADHHNELELNLVCSGSVTYLLAGSKTIVEAGKLSAFWGAIPHQVIDYGANTTYFVATIPLQCFLQWRLPSGLVQPLMQGRLINEPGREQAASDEQLFGRWTDDLRRPDTKLEEPVLLEMHARLLRLAAALPEPGDSQPIDDGIGALTDAGLNKVEQMACYIAQNYTEKLTVKQIGEFVDLHPNYAMSLFRKTLGTTLINYINQHRVSHAQRLLSTSDQTATEIALQSGFMSISRFNDVFRKACGCSPREYRKVHDIRIGLASPPENSASQPLVNRKT